jgi:hypothetical protein
MTYHLARNGQQLGTCSREDAVARYARGEILPTDLVWTEGMGEWVAASTVFGSAASSSGPTPPPMMGSSTPSTPMPSGSPMSAAGTTGVPPKKPDNFLPWAIVATILCCVPSGIAAIVFAAQVDGKYQRGDYAGAEQSAKNARLWTWISVGLGLVGIIIAVAIQVAAVAAGASY